MSVYSGFATRKDETNYNQLLAKLIRTLISHLLECIIPNQISQTKCRVYEKIITRIQKYDEHKYLEPKFGEFLLPLAQLIGLPEQVQSNFELNRFKLSTPINQRKTLSSRTQHQYQSRKVSQGQIKNPKVGQQTMKKQKIKSLYNASLHSERSIEEQAIKTPQKKDNNFMTFYTQRHGRADKQYNKKLKQLYKMRQNGTKVSTTFREKSSPDQQFDEGGRSAAIGNNYLNLKTVRQAHNHLEEGQRQDRVNRNTQNITFL